MAKITDPADFEKEREKRRRKTRTFVNSKGRIPKTSVGLQVWEDTKELTAARIFVARHCRDGTDLAKMLEMLGIQIGAENEAKMLKPRPTSNDTQLRNRRASDQRRKMSI